MSERTPFYSKPIIVLLAIVVAAAVIGIGWHIRGGPVMAFKTAAVRRGDVSATIAASGTIEPLEVIDVGAQVAGLIQQFGTDQTGHQVDYGSIVKSGDMLAKIDDSVYAADLALAQAQLEQDKAAEVSAAANMEQAKAKLTQAEAEWTRGQELFKSKLISGTDFDTYKANYEIAKANVAVADSTIAQARASTVQARALDDKARRNLDFCTIKSPVDGVIIDRRVNIGQTVVASLNAPSLFLLAKDLTKMQIWAAVNEADVGKIHAGMPVTFACDAFPDTEFAGVVGKIRLNASMTENVVMYTVEVNLDNSDRRLLPYLTANVRFATRQEKDALLVPNAALRWSPSSAEQIVEAKRNAAPKSEAQAGKSKRKHPEKVASTGSAKEGVIWVKEGSLVSPVQVKVGISDGNETVVVSSDLAEGEQVVTGDAPEFAEASTKNPFVPQVMRRH
jgi:HlyD family secretion protein